MRMERRKLFWWSTLLAVGFLCVLETPDTAGAQAGSIRGEVVDDDGQAVAGVEILVESEGGVTRRRKTKTNDKGNFTMAGLGSGMYTVTFHKEGFEAANIQGVYVPIGEAARLGEVVLPRLPEDWVDPDAQKHFDEAVALTNKGDYQAAIESFETVLELAPGHEEIHYNLAFAYEKVGNTEKTIEHYEKALELRPDYYEANLAMGDIYINRQDWSQAGEYLKKAVEARPDEVVAQYNYGAVTMNLGEMAAAQAAFEKVLELDPSRAFAHYQVGMILVSQTKNEEAIEHLEKYLELDPEGARAQTVRGILETLKQQ